MLSTVPVQRLLEGVAEALHADVAPHVDDRFALMQLRAIEELLVNLAGRVAWEPAEVAAEADGLGDVLAALRAAGWAGPAAPGATAPPADAAARRADGLAALREALAWLAAREEDGGAVAAAREAATAFLREGNDRERARLRSGMYA
ncbi:hypothetical protein FSW04_09455 [Baekduia soli]|uniref:Uncharacterized protein n=1 Tax=Baekduia soli TaxID=496014 RepID=A0A5B8U4G5_9ACTN|nr:hypothetical protein [Baekduia soli]QEC47775.1 hypothetical protein FSW04_09455 [Baekduia soli]